MADLGPEPHRSGDIAGKLERPVQSAAPVRNNLIKSGMIWSPYHGDTALLVQENCPATTGIVYARVFTAWFTVLIRPRGCVLHNPNDLRGDLGFLQGRSLSAAPSRKPRRFQNSAPDAGRYPP